MLVLVRDDGAVSKWRVTLRSPVTRDSDGHQIGGGNVTSWEYVGSADHVAAHIAAKVAQGFVEP